MTLKHRFKCGGLANKSKNVISYCLRTALSMFFQKWAHLAF